MKPDGASITFTVRGSKGNEYLVRFNRSANHIEAHCNCQAGQNGVHCKHRLGLMSGDITNLLSKNSTDVEILRLMINDVGTANVKMTRAPKNRSDEKTLSATKKRKRTDDIGIVFGPWAERWVFGVPSSFRDALDIKFLTYVDKKKSTKERKVSHDKWTRGVPPALAFDKGHVFFDPPVCRTLEWGEALKVLKRAAQVKDAIPDQENGTQGSVCFQLTYYNLGAIAETSDHEVSQVEFEHFLQTGMLADSK